jgi:hypothetical protein
MSMNRWSRVRPVPHGGAHFGNAERLETMVTKRRALAWWMAALGMPPNRPHRSRNFAQREYVGVMPV